jgi:hypothetical protein
MSYYVHAYLTDAKKVSSVYGSKSHDIFNELSFSLKNDLENLNNYFSDSINPQRNAFDVLKDIVNGKVNYPDIPFMYGYVYEKVCEYFGEEIYNSENIWQLDKQSVFIPIPLSSYFPYIISINSNSIQVKKKQYLSLKEGQGIGDYDYEEEIEDLKFIFDEAIEKKKDLLICVY